MHVLRRHVLHKRMDGSEQRLRLMVYVYHFVRSIHPVSRERFMLERSSMLLPSKEFGPRSEGWIEGRDQ